MYRFDKHRLSGTDRYRPYLILTSELHTTLGRLKVGDHVSCEYITVGNMSVGTSVTMTGMGHNGATISAVLTTTLNILQ